MNSLMSVLMSELARQSHKKNPRPREFYVEMAKKRHEDKKI